MVATRQLAAVLAAERNFGQAEVQNLGVSALGDEDVRGLDVAMHDAFGVRGVQRVGDLDGERADCSISIGLAADAMLQRQAFQKLHGDEGLAVLFADVVDRADVGMIQRGRGLRFALKARQRLRIRATSSGRNFSATKRCRRDVLGLVDHTHAAAAQLLDDAVVRDGLADH